MNNYTKIYNANIITPSGFLKDGTLVLANGKIAELIKRFLDKGILAESDLFKTDTMLLNKIRTSYEGYESIKAIKQLKGFAEFMILYD